MNDLNANLDMARAIAARAAQRGGRAYFVGGIVRDRLMGRPVKDVDIEVHGIAPAALEGILDALGERLTMGASFGVYGLRHYGIDIAMPRTERATGRGHRDFAVSVDPFLGPRRAAMRRDFTVNAMMQDVLTGEVLDFFGGRDDLARGVIRHVDDASFVEDPLRALRAAQFAARFGFAIAPQTLELCAGMELAALARERVEGELQKALTQAARPSAFFEAIRAMGQLRPWFAELGAARWDAAMATLDGAAPAREAAQSPMGLMLAALCAHMDEAGARAFLGRITAEVRLTACALELAANAERAARAARERPPLAQTNALFDAVADPDALAALGEAYAGATGAPGAAGFLARRAEDYRRTMAQPHVMGRDLIAAGLRPGADFSALLAHAHALHLAGIGREEALRQTLALAEGLEGKK